MSMTLVEAIDELGQYKAAAAAGGGVQRSLVQAWRRKGEAPRWRKAEVARIMRAAEKAKAERIAKARESVQAREGAGA